MDKWICGLSLSCVTSDDPTVAPPPPAEQPRAIDESALLSRASETDVDESALVLASTDIRYRLDEEPEGGWNLVVDTRDAPASRAALAEYSRENATVRDPTPEPLPAAPGGVWAGLVMAGALFVFDALVTGRLSSLPWRATGAANAALILAGEWWRTITALTLHADFPHVLANAAASIVFVGLLGRWLGPGLAVLLVVLSGVAGNALNAAIHVSRHVSIGASTATFGAVGLLGALAFARKRRTSTRRSAWTAFGASLGLFAMLGASPKTDVLAHLSGVASGIVLGLAAALVLRHRPAPGWVIQVASGTMSAALLTAGWVLALGR